MDLIVRSLGGSCDVHGAKDWLSPRMECTEYWSGIKLDVLRFVGDCVYNQ